MIYYLMTRVLCSVTGGGGGVHNAKRTGWGTNRKDPKRAWGHKNCNWWHKNNENTEGVKQKRSQVRTNYWNKVLYCYRGGGGGVIPYWGEDNKIQYNMQNNNVVCDCTEVLFSLVTSDPKSFVVPLHQVVSHQLIHRCQLLPRRRMLNLQSIINFDLWYMMIK